MSEKVYQGLGLSEGVAVGNVCLFDLGRHLAYPRYRLRTDDEIAREKARLTEARAAAVEALKVAAEQTAERLGGAEGTSRPCGEPSRTSRRPSPSSTTST